MLKQEGIPFFVISPGVSLDPQEISCLVLPYQSEGVISSDIISYIDEGGAVLMEASRAADIFGVVTSRSRSRYRIPHNREIFGSLGLTDFISFRKLKLAAQCCEKIDDGLGIISFYYGRGRITVLPFSVEQEILNYSYCRRKFPGITAEFPSEIVARICKGKVRKIVRICLEDLIHWRELPFVQLWYYPKPVRSIFIFRLDTDFCKLEDARSMFAICQETGIRSTWFVDTVSSSRLENFYAKFTDQEVGLHCFRHLVFHDPGKDRENIERGISALVNAGINARGYAAPFGEWDPRLSEILQEKGFIYSSEFTNNYDDLPFFPVVDNNQQTILQIPIHPVSPGRLRRSHYNEELMLEYYTRIIEQKIYWGDPVIFYHHPHHRLERLIEGIFRSVKDYKLDNWTMLDFAKWWHKRNSSEISLEISGNKIRIDAHPDFIRTASLRISSPYGETIVPASPEYDITQLKWQKQPVPEPLSGEEKVRRWHWRDWLHDYESYLGRRTK